MSGECPTVQIKDGKLKGLVKQANHESAVPVYTYMSIPFGKPPTGKRRFMPPEKSEPWSGVLDATVALHHPPQGCDMDKVYAEYLPLKYTFNNPTERQSEDCLKLNVFTPSTDKSAKLAVMLWVVGGGFMRGQAGIYDGSALSGMNNVVVVCPNYRPNALGLLSLGKGTKCPGNNALLDLILSLEWVRDNIESFGGDPSNVTIFGESAGAVLTQLLMMSPLSEGLFHKAIALSGSALSAGLFGNGEVVRKKFLNKLNITDEEPDVILQKLNNLTVEKIVEVQKDFQGQDTFQPVVDGYVITDTPENLVKTGQVHKVPFMSGVCDSEGGGILSLLSPPNFLQGSKKEDVAPIFKTFVKIQYPTTDLDVACEKLIKAYDFIAEDGDQYKYSKMYAKMGGDSVFSVPAIMSAIAHSAMGCPTFLYCMTQRVEFNHSETNGPNIKNKLDFVNCDHGDPPHYIWGVPFVKGDLPGGAWFTDGEAEFSKTTMRYMTNFAKTGNPNNGATVPVEWPNYDPVSKRHLVMNEKFEEGNNLTAFSMKLFTEELPKSFGKSP